MSEVAMKLLDLYSEVAERLKRLAEQEASQARVKWFQQQHKESRLKCYGLKTSEVRKLIRDYSRRFQQLNLQEKFNLATIFFNSYNFDTYRIHHDQPYNRDPEMPNRMRFFVHFPGCHPQRPQGPIQ